MLIVGVIIAVLILAIGLFPGPVVDRERWNEPVAEPRSPVGPDGPRILRALARRAGLDGADS